MHVDSTRNVYIETSSSNQEALAQYKVDDPNGSKFSFHWINSQLWIEFNSLDTRNLAVGGHTTLGPVDPKGLATSWFVLSGTYGNYTSTGSVDHWMEINHAELKDRTLRNLCIPNSHDTGMYTTSKINTVTPYGSVLTQELSIEGQLNKGIRWFDLRPTPGADNRWYMGHFTKTKVGWLGAYGAKLDTILAGVASFASTHNELIILELSQDNTKVAVKGDDYNLDNASDKDWIQLIDYIKNAPYVGLSKYMWNGQAAIARQGGRKILTNFPLGDFIGYDKNSLRPAIILLVRDNIPGLAYDGKDGVFQQSGSWYYESSSYQPEFDDERVQQWRDFANDPKTKSEPFSYTLSHTQTDGEAAKTFIEEIPERADRGHTVSSILYNADNYARLFFAAMYAFTDSSIYPAAINVNGITGTQYAAIAMAFNQRGMKQYNEVPQAGANGTIAETTSQETVQEISKRQFQIRGRGK